VFAQPEPGCDFRVEGFSDEGLEVGIWGLGFKVWVSRLVVQR